MFVSDLPCHQVKEEEKKINVHHCLPIVKQFLTPNQYNLLNQIPNIIFLKFESFLGKRKENIVFCSIEVVLKSQMDTQK